MKMHEVFIGYVSGKFKDGDIFLYQDNPGMSATFELGNFIWCDNLVAVSCKGLLQDVWTYQEKTIFQK